VPVAVTVDYATADGSAHSGYDYLSRSGRLTFDAGATSATVTVPIVGDTTAEPVETFSVRLTAAASEVGARIARTPATVTIDDDDRGGRFTCHGTGFSALSVKLATANPQDDPCLDDRSFLANARTTLLATPGLVVLTAPEAATDVVPDDQTQAPADGDRGVADAKLAGVTVTLGLTSIKATLLSARAEARCSARTPALTGRSTVASLAINNQGYAPGDRAMTIPAGLATVAVNSTTSAGGKVVQRALWIKTLLGDIVIGEASAGVVGNPCRQGIGTP
jgi:hypothetical protein